MTSTNIPIVEHSTVSSYSQMRSYLFHQWEQWINRPGVEPISDSFGMRKGPPNRHDVMTYLPCDPNSRLAYVSFGMYRLGLLIKGIHWFMITPMCITTTFKPEHTMTYLACLAGSRYLTSLYGFDLTGELLTASWLYYLNLSFIVTLYDSLSWIDFIQYFVLLICSFVCMWIMGMKNTHFYRILHCEDWLDVLPEDIHIKPLNDKDSHDVTRYRIRYLNRRSKIYDTPSLIHKSAHLHHPHQNGTCGDEEEDETGNQGP